LCLEIIRKKEFWALALKLGPEFVHFLEAFQAMKSRFFFRPFYLRPPRRPKVLT